MKKIMSGAQLQSYIQKLVARHGGTHFYAFIDSMGVAVADSQNLKVAVELSGLDYFLVVQTKETSFDLKISGVEYKFLKDSLGL